MSERDEERREGALEEAGDRWQLRFVRLLPHPPETVWRALTREEHLAAWFPTTIEGDHEEGALEEGDLAEGAPLRFRFREGEAAPATGEVIECEAPRVLEFTWGFAGEEGSRPERTRFELAPEGEGCRLTFTTTYDRVGRSARDAAGWHQCFDLLDARLAGQPPGAGGPERWKRLNRRYAERFGPEAATIGPPESMEEYRE